MMNVVAVSLVILFLAYVFKNYWWRIIQARSYGMDADAVVSRIEEEVRYKGGQHYAARYHYYYVTFQTQNGLENEAKLLNPKGKLQPGDHVKIRYIPEKNGYAVQMGIVPEVL